MIEHVKSFVLTLLVVLSLVQSYMLSYSSPKFDPIAQSDYVQAELFGNRIEVANLIFPEKIILHTGESTHRIVYPQSSYYKDIMENMKQTTFDGFRRINTQFSRPMWEQIREQYGGVEIRFKDGLPFDVLQTILPIKIDNAYDQELISVIWIYVQPDPQELKTYFISKSGNELFEAVKTNMAIGDIERFISRVQSQPSYRMIANGDDYIPELPLMMQQIQFNYRQYTVEELKKSLFVDPGITRNITEWDGSEIHTDGKRGLQIKNDLHWMTYSDPVAPLGHRSNYRSDLSASVLFINQHGGWDSTYVVEQVPQNNTMIENEQTFIFRQYYQSYPIIAETNVYYGYMKVSLQRGIISNYERSIIVTDMETVTEADRWLISGEQLEEQASQLHWGGVESIQPVYRPVVTDDTVTLIPAWAVRYSDETILFIDGVITKPEIQETMVDPEQGQEEAQTEDEASPSSDDVAEEGDQASDEINANDASDANDAEPAEIAESVETAEAAEAVEQSVEDHLDEADDLPGEQNSGG